MYQNNAGSIHMRLHLFMIRNGILNNDIQRSTLKTCLGLSACCFCMQTKHLLKNDRNNIRLIISKVMKNNSHLLINTNFPRHILRSLYSYKGMPFRSHVESMARIQIRTCFPVTSWNSVKLCGLFRPLLYNSGTLVIRVQTTFNEESIFSFVQLLFHYEGAWSN
jgi:hypothetical protein